MWIGLNFKSLFSRHVHSIRNGRCQNRNTRHNATNQKLHEVEIVLAEAGLTMKLERIPSSSWMRKCPEHSLSLYQETKVQEKLGLLQIKLQTRVQTQTDPQL